MHVLIVEDDFRISNAIKKGFEQEKIIVDQAFTGDEGFDLAVTQKYDVLILDLMLPGLDGLEICKKLRTEKNYTPILMLTAKGDLQDKLEGFKSGADDYLAKPFAFEELLARVKALSKRPEIISDNLLTCMDLSLNTVNFKVERAGKEILLSRKEYALLEYLLRNKNRILTKDQIISHVWDYDSDILPNTVEQYIGYLRDKIDKPYRKNKLIVTVRGFGYKIQE